MTRSLAYEQLRALVSQEKNVRIPDVNFSLDRQTRASRRRLLKSILSIFSRIDGLYSKDDIQTRQRVTESKLRHDLIISV